MTKTRWNRDRIVLLPVPCGLGAQLTRASVVDAPSQLLEGGPSGLAEGLRAAGWDVEVLNPIKIPPSELADSPRLRNKVEIHAVCRDLADRLQQALIEGTLPIILGGDHSIGIGSVAGAARYCRSRGEGMGVVWMDAHPDMNTPATSPTGNIHGMPLACCVAVESEDAASLADLGPLSTLVSPKLMGRNVCLVGARDIDKYRDRRGEDHVIRGAGVRHWEVDPSTTPQAAKAIMTEAIEAASDGTGGFHLSLDIDFLDPQYAPDAGTPYEGGATVPATLAALDAVRESGKLISLDLVEIHPSPNGDGRTIRLAIELITNLFQR